MSTTSKVKLAASELPNLLESLSKRGHVYTYITTRVEPKITVKSRETKQPLNDCFSKPAGRTIVGVIKEAEGIYSLNLDYAAKVNRTLDSKGYESNFEAESLPWGQWVDGSKILIIHNGEYYARVYEMTNNSVADKVKDVTLYKLLDNGTEIPFEANELDNLWKNFMPAEKVKKTLNEGSYDEVKPNVCNYRCSSILSIRIDGTEYTIKH